MSMSPFCVVHTFSITSLARVAQSNNTFKDSFLRLLFIESGSGYFYLNDKKHVYNRRDILLIPGNSNFIMKECQQTCFNIYAFREPFLMANKLTDCLTGLNHIEKYQSPQLFTAHENEVLQDQALLWSFHDSIREECNKKRHLHVELITTMAAACLRIVARNTTTADKSKSGDQESDLISKMIIYIDSNIHNSSHLRIAALAQTFDITKNALSHLFKKKQGNPFTIM